jgi:exosome complex exonuclease DIS3/RRP44
MRTQKALFRRNRRGNVSYVASEQYLRDDLPCGLSNCRVCVENNGVLDSSRPLLVLEASMLEEQIDLFKDGGFRNCVIPISALNVLEEREKGFAKDVRALIASRRDLGLHVFYDSNHLSVQVPRQAGEMELLHQLRQAEAVASFYRVHGTLSDVIVVSDAEHYAQAHAPELLGRVAWREVDREPRLFAPYLTRNQLDEGLEDGSLRECRVYDTCVDVVSGEEVQLADRNRALAGDRVAVDRQGRVVGLLSRRAHRLLVGTAVGNLFMSQVFLVAMFFRVFVVMFFHKDGTKLLLRSAAPARRRLVAVVDCWPAHREFPLGHIARDLGELHESGAEQEGVLASFDVRSTPFSQAQLDELPPRSTVPALTPKREDLRDIPICSVDPPGCTDIDDALHARVLPSGLFEVGVHIADVSFYVPEGFVFLLSSFFFLPFLQGSLLDLEARERSTTVYLVDRRIDMLPELLSGHLCSLVSTADRHAMSVIWTLDSQARIVSTRFCRSVLEKSELFLCFRVFTYNKVDSVSCFLDICCCARDYRRQESQ